MKTDELVAMLATSTGPVAPAACARSHAAALIWGAFGSMLVMAVALGVRHDWREAVLLPMFWLKLAFPFSLAIGALIAAIRLSSPGVRLGRVPAAVAAPVLVIWAMAAWVLFEAPSGERAALVLGETWDLCPLYIALVSAPAFVAALWAMKGLAPTRLVLSGAAGGLLAGAVGATVYALHCDEMQAPFLAVWYLLGMVIPAALGALLGPRLLRW